MTRGRRRRERGVAVVESAVIMLAFFVCVFGIMEMGRFLSVQVTLTNAAREGARFAVLPMRGTSTLPAPGAIQAQINQFLASNAIDPATANVTLTPVTVPGPLGQSSTLTQIEVQAPYQVLSLSLFSSLSVQLSGTARMRNETSDF